MTEERGNQNHLRGDGLLPVIQIEARTLAEGWHKAMIACYDKGARIETPKQREDMTLGYDADIIVRVSNPLEEPMRHKYGVYDDDRGIIQYILEVTHGIHNHWKKNPDDPTDKRWGYTYNERFVDQLPFVFQRIKADWDEKGRITGRDYQFTIWRAGEDIILEQGDPPCFQRGHLRFLINNKGEIVLNYDTDWRSRCLAKAWNENTLAQAKLQKLLADKVSKLLGVPIKVGAYIDRSSSLHIYGKYIDEDNMAMMIETMKKKPLEELVERRYIEEDETYLKRLIYVQSLVEDAKQGTNLPAEELKKLGYDINTIKYPEDWDSWPKSWDAEPDLSKLVRAP